MEIYQHSMASTQLVPIQHIQYEPYFDTDTNQYADKLPWKKSQRNRPAHTCACKSGTTFTCTTTFKNHVKSQCHKDWILKYNTKQEIGAAMEKTYQIRMRQLEQQNVRVIAEREQWKTQANEAHRLAEELEQTNNKLMREKETVEEELIAIKDRIRGLVN